MTDGPMMRVARGLPPYPEKEPAMTEPVYIVFDGMPGPNGCQFVEVENEKGSSVGLVDRVSWGDHPHSHGLTRLGPFVSASALRGTEHERDHAIARLVDQDAVRDLLLKASKLLKGSNSLAEKRVNDAYYMVAGTRGTEPCGVCSGTGRFQPRRDRHSVLTLSPARCPDCDGTGRGPIAKPMLSLENEELRAKHAAIHGELNDAEALVMTRDGEIEKLKAELKRAAHNLNDVVWRNAKSNEVAQMCEAALKESAVQANEDKRFGQPHYGHPTTGAVPYTTEKDSVEKLRKAFGLSPESESTAWFFVRELRMAMREIIHHVTKNTRPMFGKVHTIAVDAIAATDPGEGDESAVERCAALDSVRKAMQLAATKLLKACINPKTTMELLARNQGEVVALDAMIRCLEMHPQ